MFILHFLPENTIHWLVHIVLIIGIIGTILDYFIHSIPGILTIRIPLKIISTILLIVGIFFEGVYVTENEWKIKVADAEAKVAEAEAKSQHVDVVVQEKVVEKIVQVEKKVIVNHDVIIKNTEFINKECKIPEIAIQVYNTAIVNGGKINE